MNNKFFNLPKEKQNAIINAGCRVFSENSYKKSPTSEIANEAGISKSLLFHYFKNKKELYLYLYNYAVDLIMETSRDEIITTETDFFEIFLKLLKCKCKLLKQHTYLFRFMLNAYYEEDEEVVKELNGKNSTITNSSVNAILNRIEKKKFKDEVNIEQLINIIIWCGEGYIKEKYRKYHIDIDEVEKDYENIIDFFRRSSYKEEYLP